MQLGIEETFLSGSVYWNALKDTINSINRKLSNAMTSDILGQIKESSRPREVPFGQVTNEEMENGATSRFWKLKLIFDGSYSGRGFSSQDQGFFQQFTLCLQTVGKSSV